MVGFHGRKRVTDPIPVGTNEDHVILLFEAFPPLLKSALRESVAVSRKKQDVVFPPVRGRFLVDGLSEVLRQSYRFGDHLKRRTAPLLLLPKVPQRQPMLADV